MTRSLIVSTVAAALFSLVLGTTDAEARHGRRNRNRCCGNYSAWSQPVNYGGCQTGGCQTGGCQTTSYTAVPTAGCTGAGCYNGVNAPVQNQYQNPTNGTTAPAPQPEPESPPAPRT